MWMASLCNSAVLVIVMSLAFRFNEGSVIASDSCELKPKGNAALALFRFIWTVQLRCFTLRAQRNFLESQPKLTGRNGTFDSVG